MSTRFRYPPDEIIAKVREIWDAGERPGIAVWPLPSDNVVRSILDTCFHASFTADEHRGTRFTLVVCNPGRDAILLKKPVPLTVQNVTRLAPAADLDSTFLGVAVGREDDVTIWGLVSPEWCGGYFMVSVPSPGTVHVKRDHVRGFHTVITLHGGTLSDWWWPAVTPYLLAKLFPDALGEVLATSLPGRGGNYNWDIAYTEWLFDLLGQVASHGHGGAVFVVPEIAAADDAAWRQHVRVKYPCDDASAWADVLTVAEQVCVPEHLRQPNRIEAAARLRAKLRAIAQLTRVDGALVITDRFRVLGFGAEVIAPPVVETVRCGDEREDVDAYGTRHRSAFRLCAACPNVISFVCSQDGGIKCIQNIEGDVVLLR